MEINYKKNDNITFFNKCKDISFLEIETIQNYIPIYNKFFNLNENNYNNINLNNSYKLDDLTEKITHNKYKGTIIDTDTMDKKDINIFFKFCPLLDPIKYISNKYDLSTNLINLPQFNNDCHFKILDTNNSAYIDGFFTFLTSKLLHE